MKLGLLMQTWALDSVDGTAMHCTRQPPPCSPGALLQPLQMRIQQAEDFFAPAWSIFSRLHLTEENEKPCASCIDRRLELPEVALLSLQMVYLQNRFGR